MNLAMIIRISQFKRSNNRYEIQLHKELKKTNFLLEQISKLPPDDFDMVKKLLLKKFDNNNEYKKSIQRILQHPKLTHNFSKESMNCFDKIVQDKEVKNEFTISRKFS